MTDSPIDIKAVRRPDPNLRRLARALLRLVEQTEAERLKGRKKAS